MGGDGNLSRAWELSTSYFLFPSCSKPRHPFLTSPTRLKWFTVVDFFSLFQHLWTSTANINFSYLEQSIIYLNSQVPQGFIKVPYHPMYSTKISLSSSSLGNQSFYNMQIISFYAQLPKRCLQRIWFTCCSSSLKRDIKSLRKKITIISRHCWLSRS